MAAPPGVAEVAAEGMQSYSNNPSRTDHQLIAFVGLGAACHEISSSVIQVMREELIWTDV